MRLADVNDPIFETLLDEREKIVYNLFYLIRSNPTSFIATDDKSYIFAQNSRRTPNWIFLKGEPDKAAANEIVALLSGMVQLNPLLCINGNEQLLTPLLDQVTSRLDVPYKKNVPLAVYACDELHPIAPKGRIITPREEHCAVITEFVKHLSQDASDLFLRTEDLDKFVVSLMYSHSLYLWEDEKVVAMAKIAHKTDRYARINTVYTDRASRGLGYTRMLIGTLCESLMKQKLLPIVYVNDKSEESSLVYQNLGFTRRGEITQFVFEQKL